MKRIIIVLVTTLFLFIPNVWSQYKPIEDVDILEKHKYVLEKENPGSFEAIEIEGVYEINERQSKIIYYEDEIYHEAIVNSDRNDILLVATYVAIDNKLLPDVVKEAVKDDYPNAEIQDAFKVKTPYADWFYAVDVITDDDVNRVHYNEYGNPQKSPYKS